MNERGDFILTHGVAACAYGERRLSAAGSGPIPFVRNFCGPKPLTL